MNYNDVFDSFSKFRVVVVGDVMLDNYKIGKVHRMSPEAPVPVVLFEKEENRIGGAGNVALNLIALGAQPIVCSVIGADDAGKILIDKFTENAISSAGIVQSKDRPTTVKSRIISNKQQLLRIDSETTDPISKEESNELMKKLNSLLIDGIDAIIFEDYNKGVLTESLIQQIIAFAKLNHIITCVDPKFENFLSYKTVDLFKPNLKELKEGLKFDFNMQSSSEKLIDAVTQLEQKLSNSISLITLSEYGVFVKKGGVVHTAKAHPRNISDVSGAGDTVIAVACLCLLSDLSYKEIAEISNIAGGLVCESAGVVSINKDELLEEVNKLLTQ